MIKLLIGGSPCTKWSIAQKNRETEPSGIGWGLFRNYVIAKEKFKPDLFLYENNKSAAQPIKDEISKELGVDLIYINSALVSAQNRQRFYAFNWKVEQPQDRGILLADILESGQDLCGNEKSYCLTASYDGAVVQNTLGKKTANNDCRANSGSKLGDYRGRENIHNGTCYASRRFKRYKARKICLSMFGEKSKHNISGTSA